MGWTIRVLLQLLFLPRPWHRCFCRWLFPGSWSLHRGWHQVPGKDGFGSFHLSLLWMPDKRQIEMGLIFRWSLCFSGKTSGQQHRKLCTQDRIMPSSCKGSRNDRTSHNRIYFLEGKHQEEAFGSHHHSCSRRYCMRQPHNRKHQECHLHKYPSHSSQH